MFAKKITIFVVINVIMLIIGSSASASDVDIEVKRTVKRGLPGFHGGYDGLIGHSPNVFGQSYNDKWNSLGAAAPWFGQLKQYIPSPAEISTALAIAKQASSNVFIAQKQVQAEKENLLEQQRIAHEKEAHASLARQKNEALIAVQRSEANAASQNVILAQQRLGAAKAAVSHLQRAASIKEAQAAKAIQQAAHIAASESQRTEHETEKLSYLQRNDNAAAIHHIHNLPLSPSAWLPGSNYFAPQNVHFNPLG